MLDLLSGGVRRGLRASLCECPRSGSSSSGFIRYQRQDGPDAGRASQSELNALNVRMALQADCFAGVWANHAQAARQLLEQGDVEEAMNAAEKMGDDALHRSKWGHSGAG